MNDEKLEPWQDVFRRGVNPALTTAGLRALRQALVTDSDKLIQGETTSPPPMQVVLDWPPDAACPIGYCGWQGDGLETVGEVEEYMAAVGYYADQQTGEAACIRHFTNFVDDTPRELMRARLLAEVDLALAQRPDHDADADEPVSVRIAS